MHVMVLGAGVVGTTSAWFLRAAGHEVTVVDRQPQAGQETSFANGGQISVSHAEPWATPAAPLKILKWLFDDEAPLLFRPRADWQQWRWCLRFLRECTGARARRNMRQLVTLGLYSRRTLRELRAETGLRYDHLERGILHFYTDPAAFEAARRPAAVMTEHGCEVRMIDADEVVRIEPALSHARPLIAGGSMTEADESGDARKFTQGLAERAAARGVVFLHNTTVTGLEMDGGRVAGARVRQADGSYATLRADAFLVCLGSYSPLLLRPLGVDLLVCPAKGYSVTLPVADAAKAFTVSLIDDEYKLVYSRLGDRLRVAGTAELSGFDLDLNPRRVDAVLRRVRQLFPEAGDFARAQPWTGLRPTTPSNVPCIGRTRHPNLFLNTGHGTLGWTLSCGSARAVADIISGKAPAIDFDFL